MRTLSLDILSDALLRLIEEASFTLPRAEREALAAARDRETTPRARLILEQLLENADIAATERRPLCQDTGVAVIFLKIGQEVALTGGDLTARLQATVREAYTQFHLRKSIVAHPLERKNTGDNTPAIIHLEIVPGDRVHLCFVAKGGGCENMSRLAMLTPASGREGVIRFVLETITAAGGNPCPPTVVGVGIGGNFERAPLLAKEALLRPLGTPAKNPTDAALERELLEKINASNIGPMGLGGKTTALSVQVCSHPCHIAALPVAVNLDCHSHRHAEITL